MVDRGFTPRLDYAVQTLADVPYNRWRDYDPEDTIRFYALRLREAGMLKSSPAKIVADGTDWRFLRVRRELEADSLPFALRRLAAKRHRDASRRPVKTASSGSRVTPAAAHQIAVGWPSSSSKSLPGLGWGDRLLLSLREADQQTKPE
jgi:hypothetical protein